MKKFSQLLAFIVFTLIMFSCGSKRTYQEKVSAMISKVKSPFLIGSLKPQNLIDKSGVNEDGVLPYTYQTLTSFFLKEEGTGVDFNQRIQFVLAKGPMLPNGFAFFRIKDGALFKEMVKAELNAKIKDKDETNYFIKENEGYVVAWQDETAIVANIPFDIKALLSGNVDDGHKTLNRIITLFESADEGMVNKEYDTFLTQTDDINLFLMNDSFMNYIKEINPFRNKNSKKDETFKDLDGSRVELAVNFEKGKAVFKSNMSFSEEFLAKINFINNKGIDTKYLQFGKTEHPFTTYSFNFDLEKYLAFTESYSGDDLLPDINKNLSKYGLSANDIVDAFKGEVLVMLDGYKVQTTIVENEYSEPFEEQNIEPIIGMAIGLKDVSVLTDLFNNAEVVSDKMMKTDDFYVVTKDDVLFLSNDSLWAGAVSNNTTKTIQVNKVINQQPLALFTDFLNQDVSNYFKEQGYDPTSILESIVMFATINHGEITINLKDKSQNSLKVLVKFYSDMMAYFEAKQNEEMEKILDQEILDNLNEELQGLDSAFDEVSKEIDKTLKEVDIDKTIEEATKELNKMLDKINN